MEHLAERLIGSYVDRVAARSRPVSGKEINDPVWGTIRLSPLEVTIADSPLIQRLRRIRQLGVAHMVYPGAVHTRFEHSIGVLHQTQEIVNAINRDAVVVDEQTTQVLRVAALCHDVGHGVMSHVSETAVEAFPWCREIRDEFDAADGKQLSEIAAFFIVGSTAFERLVEVGQRQSTHSERMPSDYQHRIQMAIVSRQMDERVPLLHEIISGPFDADKMDYMARDALMAGVPMIADIDRLIQKIATRSGGRQDLPAEIAAHVADEVGVYSLSGIQVSGAQALDELMLGRTFLFDKVYRHQKVRAIEAMVARILHSLIVDSGVEPYIAMYNLYDEDLFGLTNESILRLISLSGDQLSFDDPQRIQSASENRLAVDLSQRLLERNLFSRFVAFSAEMPDDPLKDDSVQRDGLLRLIRQLGPKKLDERYDMIDRVAGEIRSMCSSLDDNAALASYVDENPAGYLWLEAPRGVTSVSDIGDAYVFTGDGGVATFEQGYARKSSWTHAYSRSRDLGFGFSDPSIRQYAYLAAERVFLEDFNVRLPDSMLQYSKMSKRDDVDPLRSSLFEVGYYDGTPRRLWPEPERLAKADIPDRIRTIAGRLSGYSSPEVDIRRLSSGQQASVEARIREWVTQFAGAEDSLVDPALVILENLHLIGRVEATSAVTQFLESHDEFAGASVCQLGGSKDSSAIITYWVEDLARRFELVVESLGRALDRPGTPILFVDDFIGSGSQSISILEDWLGEVSTTNLHESRNSPMTDERAAGILNRPVAFVFSAGSADGATRLRRRCEDLGIDATVYVGVEQKEMPRAFGAGLFQSEGIENQVVRRCTEIGEQLLFDEAAGHTADWVAPRTLGYGNDAYLTFFPYNIPAQSLTALWASGDVDGDRWVPVLPRRTKR